MPTPSPAPDTVRVLLVADTHLGFDLPARPRIERRRRGHDFQANFERALEPALEGDVDLVVHGGDVFHRSRVPPSLVHQAFGPLQRVAERGVPVFVVPGNHERSRIPHTRLAAHPGIHVFDRPRTFLHAVRGMSVALAGFPFRRRGVRADAAAILRDTGLRDADADVRLLCLHHCVEGATVGPGDFTFKDGDDVIRCADLPGGVAAVLSGHIHRHQILERDLAGRSLPCPVVYAGSVERTATAEMGETKGFVRLNVRPDGSGGRVSAWSFEPLPARPMLRREIRGGTAEDLDRALRAALADVPADAVLQLRVTGPVPEDARAILSAARLRTLAPAMNVSLRLDGDRTPWRRRTTGSLNAPTPTAQIALELGPSASQFDTRRSISSNRFLRQRPPP